MNKVFKVIWSEARNAYVVVSEIAKNHGSKSCSTKKLLTMLIATGVMTCASMAPAMAADPPAEALKHNTVAAGYNITVTPKDNSDGGKEYNVDLKNDIYLAGDDPDAFVSISGSRGTIWASGAVTAGSVVAGDVVMDSATGTVSGLSNKTTAYDGFATTGKAATEEQLKEVATEAGKHTTLVAGDNVQVKEEKTDNGLKYTVSATDTTYTAGNGIAINGENNAISVKLKAGEGNLVVDKDGLALNKDLQDIASISNGSVKLALDSATETAGLINGKGASVFLMNDSTVINGAVGIDKNGKISGVANGVADKDAVNVSQLKDVKAEAGKHSVVTEGANITVTPEQAEDGRMQYNVALNNDILLSGDNDAFVNISGSNGSVWASSSVAAGNGIMDGTTATVSGLGNTTTAYDGFANGEGKAATEEQLKEISKVAENANQGWNLSTNGGEASKVAPGETVDISGDKNINISNDGTNVKVKLNENIDVNSVQTNALNSKYNLSVGTMAENGIMPFFVNSTGDFYAAHNKFHVDKDGKVTATAGEIGNVVLNNGVFTGHSALRDGELFVGDASGNYSQITTKGAKLGQVVIAEDGKISNVAAGVADTDAVNVGQLKAAVEAGNTDTHIKPGEYGVGADNTVKMDVVDKNGNKVDTVTIKDVAKASDVGNVNNIAADLKNKEGKTTVVDAVNNLNNKVGDLQYSKVEKGEIADGDSTTTAIGKLDQKLTDVAATAAKHSKVVDGNNINVEETDVDGQKFYKVNMNKDIILGDLTDKYVNISGTNGTIETTGYIATQDRVYADKGGKLADIDVTGNKISNGASSIVLDGSNVKVNDKVTIDQDGKISGVAAGEVSSTSTDAINGSQLHQAKADINNRIDGVENQVINNTNNINKLGSRVNKVGAGAAALAALHPMDFDPDDKLTFSAGYGNYAGENAAAIGAYYRPDEKVMFSVAGTVGNGENMVNAGISFALDRTNHVSNSRTALAREVIDLRGQLAVMGAKMAKMEKAFGMLDETKTKLFPDIPANHWAYEYIAKLAGNGYIKGYPDGNFGGDRLMTRYEFAAMLYRAIENGAALEEKIIKEFELELGRIRVDRISGEDGDRDKIERVRVNDTKGERDHYGNKLAK